MQLSNAQLVVLQLIDSLFFHQIKEPVLPKIKHHPLLDEVYDDLGGKGGAPVSLSLQTQPIIQVSNTIISIDGVVQFNRYRAKSLRSELYDNEQIHLDLSNYRSWCRKKEDEALKFGANEKYWILPNSEKYFGPSEVGGDLGGLGSSGWKLQAYLDFLTDFTFTQHNSPVLHLSLHEPVLVQSKLRTIYELIVENQKDIVSSYLDRKIREYKR